MQLRYMPECDSAEGHTQNLEPSQQLASGLFSTFFYISSDLMNM